RARRDQPHEHRNGGGLAGAVAAEQAGDRAALKRERNPVDRHRGLVDLGEAVGVDDGIGRAGIHELKLCESAHLAACFPRRKGPARAARRGDSSGEEQAEDTTGTTGSVQWRCGTMLSAVLVEGPMLGSEQRDEPLFAGKIIRIRAAVAAAEEWRAEWRFSPSFPSSRGRAEFRTP